MTIRPGTTILHYDVSALLGKGGMGEVFRATDTKLGRQVAIKVLPGGFTRDADRIARFEREARLLASLSHPNVAVIHGVEEVDGVKFLVMELAEGENLSDRLTRGPVPLDEAIEIALQIAGALEVAHDKGIVHRDLKPANVKVDDDNRTQVLDFGLAKALETDEEAGDYSNSPTMVRAASHQGMILGTAAYMSPEQARGKKVDKRADIWAFGVVLWEMVSGKRLFHGETISDTLAAVLKEEPDWSQLPPGTPPALRRLLRRCLTRNPKDRLRDIGDARLELREAATRLDDDPAPLPSVPVVVHRPVWVVPLVLIGGILLGLGVARLWRGETTPADASHGAQLTVPFQHDAKLAVGSFLPSFTFSPDGHSLAYVGIGNDGLRRLYIRRLDDATTRSLPGTEGAEGPFFSPDGQWIGFWAPWTIMKVPVSGSGLPQVVCRTIDFRGAVWARDTIVFAPAQVSPLFSVPDSGGEPEVFTTLLPGDAGHRFPQVLPDGDTILFTALPRQFDPDRAKIATMSLSTGVRKDLGHASTDVRFSSSGHLLYVQAGRLIAVPFDFTTGQINGPAKTIVDDVIVSKNTGAAQFAVSTNGRLAWATGGVSGDDVRIARVDRSGSSTSILETPELTRHPRLSDDDGMVLTMVIGPDVSGIWVMSTDGGQEKRRLTQSSGVAVWDRDGRWIGNADGEVFWTGLFAESMSVTSREQLVRTSDGSTISATSVDPRGVVAYNLQHSDLDAGYLDPSAGGELTPFLEGPHNEGGLSFSPDGRYVAYVSDRTGQFEVYVTTFPEKSGGWQVSTAGGSEVVWRRDGKELFYRSGQDLVAVPVSLDPTFHSGPPVVLFRGPYEGLLGQPQIPNYDAAADGSWFLMLQSPEVDAAATELKIALDWPSVFAK